MNIYDIVNMTAKITMPYFVLFNIFSLGNVDCINIEQVEKYLQIICDGKSIST